MSPNLKHRLIAETRKILCQHSGGMKMTELVAELFKWAYEEKIGEKPDIEELEQLILKSYDIGLLEYEWNMGGNTARIKTFVYMKIGKSLPH